MWTSLSSRPGPTKTEGVQNAVGIDFTQLPLPMMEPSRVVRKALKGLGHRSQVIPGGTNKFMDVAGKYLRPQTRADKNVRPAAASSPEDALNATGVPPQTAAQADNGDRPRRHNKRGVAPS